MMEFFFLSFFLPLSSWLKQADFNQLEGICVDNI